MNKNAVLKTIVAGLLAAGAAAGTPYLTDQHVDATVVIVNALTAVVAYLSKSPRQ